MSDFRPLGLRNASVFCLLTFPALFGCGGGGGGGPTGVDTNQSSETLASFELSATSPCIVGEAFWLTDQPTRLNRWDNP